MEKIIGTYALLAYLKENSAKENKSIFDIYIPIVKKSLSEYSRKNNLAEIMGVSFSEIQNEIEAFFGIKLPIPVLSSILFEIEKEINNDNIFKIHNDKSFVIKSYIFGDIDELIEEENNEINFLCEDFYSFCKEIGEAIPFEELIAFVKSQSIDLFTAKQSGFQGANYNIAKYVETKIKEKDHPSKVICNIYLGSLIASYFEINFSRVSTNVTLLIDTNFFISLIDLNTKDSCSVCNQLLVLCKKLGYNFKILQSTILQIKILLNRRIEDFGSMEYLGTVKCADIFNACLRRKITKTTLQSIRDSVEKKLSDFGIETIYDAQIKDIIERAKKDSDLRQLEKKRNNYESALNDLVAKYYVEKYRGATIEGAIADFCDIKCWFLHNSFSPYAHATGKSIMDRWSIGANELLVLLWMANPAQSAGIKSDIVSCGGLASYITKYRRHKIPSAVALKEIKSKMDYAVKQDIVDEQTVFNMTIRMAEGGLDQELTDALISSDGDEFNSKLREYQDKYCTEIRDLKNQIIRVEIERKKDRKNSISNELTSMRTRKNNAEKQAQGDIVRFKASLLILYFIVILIWIFTINKIGWDKMEMITYFVSVIGLFSNYLYAALKCGPKNVFEFFDKKYEEYKLKQYYLYGYDESIYINKLKEEKQLAEEIEELEKSIVHV